MENRFKQLPKDKDVAKKFMDAQTTIHRQEMGKIGEFFGSKENAMVYLAEILVLFALIFAGIIAYADEDLRADALKAVITIATLALGYMFGAGTRKRD